MQESTHPTTGGEILTPERTLLRDGRPVVLPVNSYVFVKGNGHREPTTVTIVRDDVLALLREIDQQLVQTLPPEMKYKRLFTRQDADSFPCWWPQLGENERLMLGLDTLFVTQIVFDKFDVTESVQRQLLVAQLDLVPDVASLLGQEVARLTLN